MNSQLFSHKFCIACQTSVLYLELLQAHTIPLNSTSDGPSDYKECYGPFTETEPPFPLEEGWQDQLMPPDFVKDYYFTLFDFDLETEQVIMIDPLGDMQ